MLKTKRGAKVEKIQVGKKKKSFPSRRLTGQQGKQINEAKTVSKGGGRRKFKSSVVGY